LFWPLNFSACARRIATGGEALLGGYAQVRQLQIGVRVAGLSGHHLQIYRARLLRLSLRHIVIPQVVLQRRRTGEESQGLLVGRLGLAVALLGVQDHAQQAQRGGVAWSLLQGGTQGLFRFAGIALLKIRCGFLKHAARDRSLWTLGH
jgi:hypothetical protein